MRKQKNLTKMKNVDVIYFAESKDPAKIIIRKRVNGKVQWVLCEKQETGKLF